MSLNRRAFIGTSIAATAALSAPMVRGQGKPRVVVVGGGAGGATAARYIAKDSDGAIDVTLIEPTRTYYTCFFSNLYLGGFREIAHQDEGGSIRQRRGDDVAPFFLDLVQTHTQVGLLFLDLFTQRCDL